MNRAMHLLTAAVLAVGGLSTVYAASAPDLILGIWSLDTSKSKFTPGPAPKSKSRTYTQGDDGISLSVDTVAADGSAARMDTTYHYDGKDYPVKGDPNFDTVAVKRINASVAKSTLKKSGKIVGHSTRTISGGGHTLTLTGTETDAKGVTHTYTEVYAKT